GMLRARLVWGLLAPLSLFACSNDDPSDEAHVLDGQDFTGGKADGAAATPPGEVVRLSLDYAAVPGTDEHPNMVVYIPTGLSTADGVNVIVYLHGHMNCADNVIQPKNGPCVAGHGAREAGNLANQLEASKKNAILLVPELALDAADSSDFDLDNQY